MPEVCPIPDTLDRMDSPDSPARDVISVLASIPELASDIAGAIDGTRLSYRHGPGFPSLEEVVCHLCRSGPAFDSLLHQARGAGQGEVSVESLLTWDAGPLGDVPIREHLDDFARIRRRSVDVLRGLDEATWTRRVPDRERGSTFIGEICEVAARHESGHLAQVRNLIALLPG